MVKRGMPTPDIPPRPLRRDIGGRSFVPGFAYLSWVDALGKRKRPGKRKRDRDDGGVPVEPDRPNSLSGGAEAPLEFERD